MSRDGVAVQEGHIKKQSLPQKFKFGPWLVAATENESYLMTHILDDMQIKVSVVEEHLNLELSGTSKWLNGLLEELTTLDVALIEKQTKVVSSTTLLINGTLKYSYTIEFHKNGSKPMSLMEPDCIWHWM